MNFINKLLTITVASTLLLATVFAKCTAEEVLYTLQSYNHCWIKHTVTIEKINGHGYEVDHWDTVCATRTYYQPKEVQSD